MSSGRRDALGSGLIVFVLLVGYIKGSPLIPYVPVDLTLLGVAALGLFVAESVLIGGIRLPLSLVLLSLSFVLPAFTAPQSDYADTKVAHLFFITVFVGIGSAVVIASTNRFWWMLRWFALGALFIGLLLRFAPVSDPDLYGRFALEGTNTLAVGRGAGAGLVAVWLLVSANKLRWQVGLPAAVVLLTLLFGSGSRGPLLAVVVAVGTVIASRRGVRRVREVIIVGVLGVIGVAWALASVNQVSLDRFALLFSADRGDSVTIRQILYQRAWDVANAHPWGVGWGGLEPELAPLAPYPHNILLEVFAEGGWLVGVVLVVTFAAALRSAMRSGEAGIATAGMLAFWMVNALVSGDINDNRALFALLGAALVSPAWLRPGERDPEGSGVDSLRARSPEAVLPGALQRSRAARRGPQYSSQRLL